MINPFANALTLFAIPDFRRTWAIGGLTGVARWLEFVAIAIFAYELTHSPELVALLAVLRMMPYVGLGLVVGALSDTFDRRQMLRASLAFMAAVAATMATLAATRMAGYAAAAIATMCAGAFWTVDMPVRRQLLVTSVGPARMTAALGLDNATNYATRAVGPLIGGLIYELVGIHGIYVLISVCYAAGFWLASRVAPKSATDVGEIISTARSRFWQALLPPRALVTNRRFQVIMGVTLVYNLWCFPFISMVPVIAQKDFLLSPFLVGCLSACDGIGGMIGALAIGALVSERRLFRVHYLGTMSFLLLIGAFSLLLMPSAAVVILLLLGLAAACFSATQYALVYVIAPPEMRGRATGVLSVFIGSSMIGHYHAGYLFERLGSASAMKLMAIEGLAALLLLGWAWRRETKPAAGSRAVTDAATSSG